MSKQNKKSNPESTSTTTGTDISVAAGGGAASSAPGSTVAAASAPALKPVVTLGMVKVEGGWSVIRVTTVGYEVINTEILGDPEVGPKEHADNLLKFEVVKQFMWQGTGPKA